MLLHNRLDAAQGTRDGIKYTTMLCTVLLTHRGEIGLEEDTQALKREAKKQLIQRRQRQLVLLGT